jgi:hypothetical protein
MRSVFLAAALLAALTCAPAYAAGADDPLLAPIHQFVDGLNKGDMKAAAAAHVAAPSIIDDVPPHSWQGDGALDKWAAADDADMKKHDMTDAKVAIQKPSHLQNEGDVAYVVVPTVYSFKMKGKKVAENGYLTFALAQQGSDWKIAAWTWTRR